MTDNRKSAEAPTPPAYRAYLVRMWQIGAEGPWRASAESTATRRVYHFAHLEELFAFLAEGASAREDDERA